MADGNVLRSNQRFLKSGVDAMNGELANDGYAVVRYTDDFLVLIKPKPDIEKGDRFCPQSKTGGEAQEENQGDERTLAQYL